MLKIRSMIESDIQEVLNMMEEFYNSPAVFTNGSQDIYKTDIAYCLDDFPFLEGYVFSRNENILGYAMIAKSFSTEFGKPCLLLEDLYIKPDYRGCGIGTQFFAYIERKYPNYMVKLEVEAENTKAINMYNKCGFDALPYIEMKKFHRKSDN